MNSPEETTKKIKKSLSKRNIPVLCDVIANLNGLPSPFIYRHDLFLGNLTREQEEKLQPDLLITFGLQVLSKNLKLFLRKNKPRYHFHIQPAGHIPDTFQSLTHIIPMDPAGFFDNFTEAFEATSIIPSYSEAWQKPENETKNITDKIETSNQLTVIGAVRMILNTIPAGCNIHIANSLPVRLVNYLGLTHPDIRVFANRGTSGIDGCTSTAVGVSLTSGKMNVLITGDMAFFYDRNALWHSYIPKNLKIIILNNHGGGIFRMIDGPGKLPELKEYFETDQKLNAAQTARDFGATYFSVKDYESLKKTLPSFFRHSGSLAILEVETDSETDKKIFVELKNEIRKIWN